MNTSEQKLARCEMNTKGTESRVRDWSWDRTKEGLNLRNRLDTATLTFWLERRD